MLPVSGIYVFLRYLWVQKASNSLSNPYLNLLTVLINWELIRSLHRLSMWKFNNESASMARASPSYFLSPVMSISSRTINLGNNASSQHLGSHYVRENSSTENEKSAIKFFIQFIFQIFWVLSTWNQPVFILDVSCKQIETKNLISKPSQMLKAKDSTIHTENETFAVVIGSIELNFNFLN